MVPKSSCRTPSTWAAETGAVRPVPSAIDETPAASSRIRAIFISEPLFNATPPPQGEGHQTGRRLAKVETGLNCTAADCLPFVDERTFLRDGLLPTRGQLRADVFGAAESQPVSSPQWSPRRGAPLR